MENIIDATMVLINLKRFVLVTPSAMQRIDEHLNLVKILQVNVFFRHASLFLIA
jgi:hypothetical protein